MDPTRYLFKATYTPYDPDEDRRRKSCVIETKAGVMDAITGAVSKLEIDRLHDDVVREYLESIGSEDTTDGWAWEVGTNNGEWHFEWSPFDVEDPVTKEALKAWAMAQSDTSEEEAWVGVLACIMGRWDWRSLEWQSEGDLRESLHDIAMDGYSAKGYNEMTGDELLEAVMEGPVQAASDNFDEVVKGKPFGMAVMLSDDRELWFGER